MDELDYRILDLLAQNARIPVKEIASRIALTSPAVSSRIHRMEQSGIIQGYTVNVRPPEGQNRVSAFVSLSTKPSVREQLMDLVAHTREVLQCFHVTGDHSYLIRVSCEDMSHLEHLLTEFQQLGQTSTQIILSAPVDRSMVEILDL